MLSLQERRIIAFVIALGIILTSVSVSTDPKDLPILSRNTFHLSSEVWSDDFENVTKTLSEWTIDGWGGSPNVTLSNGLLYVNGTWPSVLSHNSSTAIGTWSFDMFHNAQESKAMVVFMSPYPLNLDTFITGNAFYGVEDNSQYTYKLAYWLPTLGGAVTKTLDNLLVDTPSGWSHIDITRQANRWMYVFLNGTMILKARDDQYDTSEYFRLFFSGPVVFDNITVSDTVDFDGVPPHWTEPLVDHAVNIGDDFSHVLHADDYSGLDTWWVNDSLRFAVDDEGVVANVIALPIGNYGIEVSVNDTFGNVLNGSLNVEVVPTNTTTPTVPSTGPNPLDLLTITLFGAAGVVLFVPVIFIFSVYRKRRTA